MKQYGNFNMRGEEVTGVDISFHNDRPTVAFRLGDEELNYNDKYLMKDEDLYKLIITGQDNLLYVKFYQRYAGSDIDSFTYIYPMDNIVQIRVVGHETD